MPKVELLCLLGHEMRIGEDEKYQNSMEEAHKLYSENKTEFDKYALSEVIYLDDYACYLSKDNLPTEPQGVRNDTLAKSPQSSWSRKEAQ